jgi:hypothetical protein
LPNISFSSTPNTTYTIYSATPTFYYRDSKQNAEIVGQDLILITGGILEVDIKFNWMKKDAISPTI